jgi:hypothetical protein
VPGMSPALLERFVQSAALVGPASF